MGFEMLGKFLDGEVGTRVTDEIDNFGEKAVSI